MKQMINRVLCAALAIGIIFGTTACGNTSKPAKGNSAGVSEENGTSVEQGADVSTDDSQEESLTGGEQSGTQASANDSGQKATSQNTTKKVTTTTVPLTNLTLDQVMKKMPAKLKGTTINYFVWYNPAETVEGDVITQFTKKYGITVKYGMGSYSNYATELSTKVAAKNGPDMAKMLVNSVARTKTLQPLENTGFNFNDSAWDQTTMKDYTFNGKAYATNLKNTAFYDGLVIFYNKKTFANNDIEDPYKLWKAGKWTWDAFKKVATAYGKIGKDYFGASFCPMSLYASNMGTGFVTYDGKQYKNNMKDTNLVKAWSETVTMIDDGLIHRDTWKMDEFMGGKCGMFFASISGARTSDTGYKKFKAKKELAIVPLPSFKSGKSYQPLIEYSAWGVPKTAKNPQAVPYLLRYMLDLNNYPSDLFMDVTSKEIYLSMIKNPNRAIDQSEIITADSGMSGGDMIFRLKQTEADQMATKLDEYSNIVQDAVNKANAEIKKYN